MSHTETKEVPIFQLFLEGIAIVRRDLMEPGWISLFLSRTIAFPNHSLVLLLAQQGYTQEFWGDAIIDRSTIHSSFPPNYLYLQHFSRLRLLLPQSLSYPYSCNNFVLAPNVWECIMDFAFFFSHDLCPKWTPQSQDIHRLTLRAFDQRWLDAFSFRVSKLFSHRRRGCERRKDSVKQYMPVHISSRSYSPLWFACMHGIWHMAYGICRKCKNIIFFFFIHPTTQTHRHTHIHHRHRLSRLAHIRYAQTPTVFVLRTQQICIQSIIREIEK